MDKLKMEIRTLRGQIDVLQKSNIGLAKKNNTLLTAGQAQDARLKATKDAIRLRQVEEVVSRALAWRYAGFTLHLYYRRPTETDHGLLCVHHVLPGQDWRRACTKPVPNDDVSDLRRLITAFVIDAASTLDFLPIRVEAEKPGAAGTIADEEPEADDEI